MNKIISILLLGVLAGVSAAACSPTQTQVPAGMGETWAAFTMAAVLTQSAFGTLEAKLTQVSVKTPTPEKTPSPKPSSSQVVSPPAPQQTTINTGGACNWAGFVRDVTIPDNTRVEAEQEFTKTWRLKNLGTCTWTGKYSLVNTGGELMGAPETISMPNDVPPGSEVDISVKMVAPKIHNTYLSYWTLRDDKNNLFGVGTSGKQQIYLKIIVGDKGVLENSQEVLNIVNNYCSASWFSGTGLLPCPGTYSEETGSINYMDTVLMEGDSQSNEPTLVTIPNAGQNGVISGQFPAFKVQYGDRFKSRIGCVSGFPACDVTFQLSYKSQDGQTRTLGTWGHTLDAYIDDLDIDLTPAAGMNIELIMTILNNGSSVDDHAFWAYPRIVRP